MIPILGIWENAEQIDFSILPTECFLKCNHGSGFGYTFKYSKETDKKSLIKNINNSLKKNYYKHAGEWPYKNVKPVILAEETLKYRDGTAPLDYKFFCFNGNPIIFQITSNIPGHKSG